LVKYIIGLNIETFKEATFKLDHSSKFKHHKKKNLKRFNAKIVSSHKKHKKHKVRVLSLQTNNFQISSSTTPKTQHHDSNLHLSDLPKFTFLSQNNSEDLKKESIEDNEKNSKNNTEKELKESDELKSLKKVANLINSIPKTPIETENLKPSLFDDLLVLKLFSKNEEKCELWTAKSLCINSNHVVPSNSYNSTIKRLKHLIKSKNQARFKLSPTVEPSDFDHTHRNTFLELNMSSNMLFNRSDNSYFVENNCEPDFGMNHLWKQSLKIEPFRKFIEVLPGSKVILFNFFRFPGF
jgi:hypothetical protein